MLNITIFNPQKIVFKGTAKSVTLPGESGTFEVLPYHKRVISRLITGPIVVDGQLFSITRGVAKVDGNELVVIAEGVT